MTLDIDLKIREIRPTEYVFLEEMLYQAIFVADENVILPRDIIEHPDIKKYISDFGKNNDFAFVAEVNGELVGAIWIRIFDKDNKAFGFVDSETPELSMAVTKEFRAKGVGTKLLKTMLEEAKYKYKKVSLSVDKENFAYKMYRKFGFVDYNESDDSITMVKKMPFKN